MNKKHKITLLLFGGIAAAGGLAFVLLRGTTVAVLAPQGSIAQSQLDLIIFTSLLSLIVVIPVFVLTFHIVWKYRASNTKATYTPDWDHSRAAETAWWGIPLILIIILAGITWTSTHRLDPYRSIVSDKPPITIQVVALQWKWLFIYPDQDIASVNYLQIPEDTPINFEITADAPMNSFWIPQLGGQVYAMAGMQTKLHLIADKPGEYRGSSANISGDGFAGMHFIAKATSKDDFDKWVKSAKASSSTLDMTTYNELAKPSNDTPLHLYSSRDKGLYDTVMMKYMSPEMQKQHAAPEMSPDTDNHTHRHDMEEHHHEVKQ